MSSNATFGTVDPALDGVRRTVALAVGVIVGGAVLFFVDLIVLTDFREFIAGPGDGTLVNDALIAYRTDQLIDHQAVVVAGYVLIGVGTLMLGIGSAMIAAAVARAAAGWRRSVATWASRLLLAGGVVGLIAYGWPGYWFDENLLAHIGLTTISNVAFLAGFVAIAFGLIGLGAVMVAGSPWPRWTSVPLVFFPILVFVTSLPLFFQIGATIAALGILVSLRPKRLARMTA